MPRGAELTRACSEFNAAFAGSVLFVCAETLTADASGCRAGIELAPTDYFYAIDCADDCTEVCVEYTGSGLQHGRVVVQDRLVCTAHKADRWPNCAQCDATQLPEPACADEDQDCKAAPNKCKKTGYAGRCKAACGLCPVPAPAPSPCADDLATCTAAKCFKASYAAKCKRLCGGCDGPDRRLQLEPTLVV